MQTQAKNNAHNPQKTRSERDNVPPHIFTYTEKRKTPHRAKNAPQGIKKAAHDPQTVNGYILVMFQKLPKKEQRYNY